MSHPDFCYRCLRVHRGTCIDIWVVMVFVSALLGWMTGTLLAVML